MIITQNINKQVNYGTYCTLLRAGHWCTYTPFYWPFRALEYGVVSICICHYSFPCCALFINNIFINNIYKQTQFIKHVI